MDERLHEGNRLARKGFFPLVIGRNVQVRQGGGVLFAARHDLSVTQGGGQWLVAGGNQTVQQGGGAVLLSRQAHVTNGFVGLLVAGRTTLDGEARVLATLSVPVALAALGGLVAGFLLGRVRAR